MAKQTVTAFFSDRELAETAVLLLHRFAIPDDHLTISPEAAVAHEDDMPTHVHRFWGAFEAMFGTSHDRFNDADSVRRGRVMVIADVDEADIEGVVAVLARYGGIDVNVRESVRGSERRASAGDTFDADTGLRRSSNAATRQAQIERAAAAVLATPSARDAYRKFSLQPDTARAAAASERELVFDARGSDYARDDAATRGKPLTGADPAEASFTQVTTDRGPREHVAEDADRCAAEQRQHAGGAGEANRPSVTAEVNPAGTRVGRGDDTDHEASVTRPGPSTKLNSDDGPRPFLAGTADDTPAVQRARGLEVIGCDGGFVGIIERIEGTMIRLTASGPDLGAGDQLIPTTWIHSIDGRVMLKITSAEAKHCSEGA